MSIFSFSFAEESEFHRFWPDNLFAVEVVDNSFVVMAGYSGTVLKTEDAGESWQAIYIGKNELIRRISFVDKKNGWAIGHRGTIFNTKDGANTWTVQHQVPGVYLRDIDFSDSQNGWVVGHDANIWNTKDGGLHWIKQTLNGYLGRDIPRLHGILAQDAQSAILVGEFGVVAHTEDGGEHWSVTPVINTITYLSIAGNENKIYLVGLEGTVVELSKASEEQRQAIDDRVSAEAAKKEKRARAKAKRRKREYLPPPKIEIYRPEFEFVLQPINSESREHLFDVAIAGNGNAIIVGRATISRIQDGIITPLTPAKEFPLDFVWLGGVDVSSDGKFWASGIRGFMVSGSMKNMSFKEAGQLAASKNIELMSSRWDKE